MCGYGGSSADRVPRGRGGMSGLVQIGLVAKDFQLAAHRLEDETVGRLLLQHFFDTKKFKRKEGKEKKGEK